MISSAIEACTAFSVTNIDDIFILVVLFSRVDQQFRGIHVVAGQFLGIAALVTVSLFGFAGRALLPEAWIGLLGLLPISLGFSQLIEHLDPSVAASEDLAREPLQGLKNHPGIGWAGIIGVASLTIANGSDNIGVYMPMFAHQDLKELLLTLIVFSLLTGCWCLLAWRFTKAPAIAALLQRYGQSFLPAVLIAIGGLILFDSHALQHPPQVVITLTSLAVMVLSVVRQLQASLNFSPLAGVRQP